MSHSCLNFLKLGTGSGERSIAVRRDEGAAPGVFWMGGFKSDMKGTKAEALAQWARENGRSCLRFDYSGHGESSGDFTEVLMWQRFPAKIRQEIATEGVWHRPSDYGEPFPITRGLIEDGRKHLLLGGMIETGCPVRILQGVQDPDVPWNHAVALTSRLAQDDVVLTLVKDGDHRLSRPEDLERLMRAVAEF